MTFERLMDFKQNQFWSWEYYSGTFKSFFQLSYKHNIITFFCDSAFKNIHETNINQQFWGVTQKYEFRVSFRYSTELQVCSPQNTKILQKPIKSETFFPGEFFSLKYTMFIRYFLLYYENNYSIVNIFPLQLFNLKLCDIIISINIFDPSRHLHVQSFVMSGKSYQTIYLWLLSMISQKWKHRKIFKGNRQLPVSEDAKKRAFILLYCLYCWLWTSMKTPN